MKKKFLIVSGVFLIIASFLLYFGFRRWSLRIPPGWKWEANFIGIQMFPDEKGVMPVKFEPSVYIRTMTISDDGRRPAEVILKDQYMIKDPMTNEIQWEYIVERPNDPRTGMHRTAEYHGDYNLFPRDVEKKTYRFRANYIEGIPLAFQGEEEFEGLLTYIFAYKGRGEYTKSYMGTDEYPGVQIKPGQEIKCRDDQFIFKVWVEPVTGEIIRLEESCYSGDYLYDISSGKEIFPVMVWGGATSGDDNMRRVIRVRQERLKLLLISRYLPLLCLIAGGLLTGVVIVKDKKIT